MSETRTKNPNYDVEAVTEYLQEHKNEMAHIHIAKINRLQEGLTEDLITDQEIMDRFNYSRKEMEELIYDLLIIKRLLKQLLKYDYAL